MEYPLESSELTDVTQIRNKKRKGLHSVFMQENIKRFKPNY